MVQARDKGGSGRVSGEWCSMQVGMEGWFIYGLEKGVVGYSADGEESCKGGGGFSVAGGGVCCSDEGCGFKVVLELKKRRLDLVKDGQ